MFERTNIRLLGPDAVAELPGTPPGWPLTGTRARVGSEHAVAIGLVTSATLADGRVVDVALDGPLVRAVGAPGTVPAGPGSVLDAAGHVLLTAPAEPHAHLDKALTWDRIAPPTGDLRSAIDSFHAFAAEEDEEGVLRRGRAALTRMLANGITAVRSHVNFYPDPDPLRGVRAMVALRDEFAGLLELELVALPGWDTPTQVVAAALDAGVDLVGGAPHLAPEPFADLHRLLDLAEARGTGVDLHTDESLDGPLTLQAYAERTRDWPVVRSAGHCVRLGTLDAAELAPVLEAVRAADIGIITLPITNLYLQGLADARVDPARPHRAARPARRRDQGRGRRRQPARPVQPGRPRRCAGDRLAARHRRPPRPGGGGPRGHRRRAVGARPARRRSARGRRRRPARRACRLPRRRRRLRPRRPPRAAPRPARRRDPQHHRDRRSSPREVVA